MASETHLAELLDAGDIEHARLLCTDLGYLEGKCTREGIAAVAEQLKRVADAVPGTEGHILRELHRVMQDEASWLQEAPGALAVTVFNRLFCAGWPRQKLEEVLLFPRGLPPLHLRRPAIAHSLGRLPKERGLVATNGQWGVSSSAQGMQVWEVETGLPVVALKGLRGGASACAMSADGRRVAASSANGYVRVWDTQTGEALAMLGLHFGSVWGCAITADGSRVLAACNDGSVTVWNVETAQALQHFYENGWNPVVACAVTDDARWAVSAHKWDKGPVWVWELATGKAVAALEGPQNTKTCCAVTADGQRVVAGADDGTLTVWEVATGKILSTFKGHRGDVAGCAMAADGRWVVSASYDGTLKLWELPSGRCLQQLHGGTSFRSVAAARDIICAGDGVGRAWILSATHTPPSAPSYSDLSTAPSRRMPSSMISGGRLE